MLKRIFAYFTLAMYLVVGTVAVRVLSPKMTTIEVSTSYLSLFKSTTIKTEMAHELVAPEMNFAEIKFPAEKKIFPRKVAVKKPAIAPVVKVVSVQKNELPFHEPVVLEPVKFDYVANENLVALYKDFSYETTSVASVEDEISTKQAKSKEVSGSDAEPEFFEYPAEKIADAKPVTHEEKNTPSEIKEEVTPDTDVANVESSETAEKVDVDELLVFDYSKANADVKSEVMPTVSAVTTQAPLPETQEQISMGMGGTIVQEVVSSQASPVKTTSTPSTTNSKPAPKTPVTSQRKETVAHANKLLAPKSYSSQVAIQVLSTNLQSSQSDRGFEVRFQDDLGDAVMDYGAGEVVLTQALAQPKMTRSITILKRGFAPTNSDLIFENDSTSVSIPLIEEDTFNEVMAPFESRGAMGMVLVELDDEAEGATLDVPFSKVLQLDGDLRPTESNDFRYQLFVGVKAGNALLSYKDSRGQKTSKIIHIHEREVSYEMNFFEDVKNERVTLVEEDLLGKEKTPLIISSEMVREFATDKPAKKVNDHTFLTDYGRTLLGGRKYLELTHQSESVFVGFREASTINVPSEGFMRYVLSRFENSRLGNRCLVQVNLNKKVQKVDVAAESVESSLVTYTQILDADGKFYDSASEKSRKVIVVGENQGSGDIALEGKINIKITYQDGSNQFIGSYCSPNTYLVEQL